MVGSALGWALALSIGGTMMLATMAASAARPPEMQEIMRRLYEALATGRASDGTIDVALESVLGLGRAQFVASWGEWVAARSR